MTKRLFQSVFPTGCLCLVLGLSGCATMKSPADWFNRDRVTSTGASAEQGGLASALTNTGKGISNQFKSMGSAVSSAYTKTKNAVTSPFSSRKISNEDPTSLSYMPTDLGPEIWVTNGQLYESQGNFAKALDNYTKALELEPNSVTALLSTARLYERQSKHGEAVEMYRKAISVKPDAAIYNELAMAYNNLGRPVEAKEAFQQAIQADPSNARYRNNLAGVLVAEGRSDEAVANLQQIFPPAVANYNVAYLHFSNQNLAAAQQHLQTAMQLDPNLQQARELANQIASNPAAQSAMAVYQTAGSIYRTAEAAASATVPAKQAVHQSGTGSNVLAPAMR